MTLICWTLALIFIVNKRFLVNDFKKSLFTKKQISLFNLHFFWVWNIFDSSLQSYLFKRSITNEKRLNELITAQEKSWNAHIFFVCMLRHRSQKLDQKFNFKSSVIIILYGSSYISIINLNFRASLLFLFIATMRFRASQ